MPKINIKLPGIISISTSIILIIVGAYLIKFKTILIDQIIFLLAISLASYGLLMMVRKFRYNRDIKEFWLGLLIVVLGVVLAVFSDKVMQYGLMVIGGLFIVYGVVITVQSATGHRPFYLSLGISRIVIGAALIVLAFVTGTTQATIALITGIVALSLGLLFLVFEK